jgi:hypothetical protein
MFLWFAAKCGLLPCPLGDYSGFSKGYGSGVSFWDISLPPDAGIEFQRSLLRRELQFGILGIPHLAKNEGTLVRW